MTATAGLHGLVAGYLCFISGFWLDGANLPRVDLGQIGLRYAGDRPSAWYVGIVHHLVNSSLLGVLYHAVVRAGFGAGDGLVTGVVVGGLYGLAVWAVLPMSIIFPITGRGWFGSRLDDRRVVMSNVVIHLVFGVALGVLEA